MWCPVRWLTIDMRLQNRISFPWQNKRLTKNWHMCCIKQMQMNRNNWAQYKFGCRVIVLWPLYWCFGSFGFKISSCLTRFASVGAHLKTTGRTDVTFWECWHLLDCVCFGVNSSFIGLLSRLLLWMEGVVIISANVLYFFFKLYFCI